MKIKKVCLLAIVAIASLLSVSCTKNEETVNPLLSNPIIEPGFKVDFKGITYKTLEASAEVSATTIRIITQNPSGENFTINLSGNGVGEYATNGKAFISYKEKTAAAFGFVSLNGIGTTATVNVLSIDNATMRIKGTFKFIGNYDGPANATSPADILFTNGTFDVPYTIPNPLFFKVDFNGKTFNSTTTTAVLTSGQIIIGAKNSATPMESFSIALEGNRLGDFTSADDLISYMVTNAEDNGYINFNSTLTTNTGKVTITEIDIVNKTVSGTFNYIGNWSDFLNLNPPAPIAFTNGSFKIPYTETVPSTDTFFAKVNDVEFVESFIATALATVGTESVISINATNSADDRISISINDTYLVGNTYSAATEAKCSLKEGTTSSNAATGTVKIISKTATNITGIFSFTTISGKIVTEGAFDVEY